MRVRNLIAPILAVAVAAACTESGPTEAGPGSSFDETSFAPTESAGELSAGAQVSNVDVVLEADPATVVGRSHLTRTEKGLRGNVRTSGLTPGDVVTLWVVAFQNPDGCIGACDNPAEDIGPGNAALALVGGHIVPSSGKVTIAGKLDVGDATGPVGAEVFETPIGSEVHLVIRTHGQVIPGLLEEQMGSLNGGCPPNACVSIQVGIHQP